MVSKRELYDKQKNYFTLENCPFCTKLDKKRIVFETKYWIVMKNANPYFDDENGLMTIPKRHIEFTTELKKEELEDFIEIEKWMKSFFEDKGDYFSFIRQSKSNKSVEHMHHHYIVGIPSPRIIDGENYLKIKSGYKS